MPLKTTNGKKSHTTTIALISFYWVLIALTLGLLENITIGTTTLSFRMIDPSLVMALLTPAFGLYGFRRYTEKINSEDLRK